MSRPFDNLFQLRMREVRRFPLTDAFCRCLDENTTLRARFLGEMDRARVRGETMISKDPIPSIFAEPPRRHERISLRPIDDDEPTILQWGTR